MTFGSGAALLILPRLMGLNGVIYAQPAADLLAVLLSAVFAIGLHRELGGLSEAAEAPLVKTVKEGM